MSVASLYDQDLWSLLSGVIKAHAHSHINGIHLWRHVVWFTSPTLLQEQANRGDCVYILQLPQTPFQLVDGLLRRTITAQSPPLASRPRATGC